MARDRGTPGTERNRSGVARFVGIGIASGVVLGIGARLVMHLIARESGVAAGFSLGGTLEVILFGLIVGAPAAWAFLGLAPLTRIRRPFPGLVWGFVLFVGLALAPPPAARSALAGTPDTPWVTATLFCSLFLLWGVGLDTLERHSR